MKYSKKVGNVTYDNVGKVEVRTYPCLKFGSYNGTPLTGDQKETLRFRRIKLVVYEDETKMKGMKWGVTLLTKKQDWGKETMERIINEVVKEYGDFSDPKSDQTYNNMVRIGNKIREHNDTLMGIIVPKVTRDPKTGRFMKATA